MYTYIYIYIYIFIYIYVYIYIYSPRRPTLMPRPAAPSAGGSRRVEI